MSRLIKNNTLAVGEDGVYSHPTSAEKDFAYSDGSEAEKYLFSVFSECEDLGSHSEELQLKIKAVTVNKVQSCSQYYRSEIQYHVRNLLSWFVVNKAKTINSAERRVCMI